MATLHAPSNDETGTSERLVYIKGSLEVILTKIIAWVLPTNVGEGMILLLAVLLGIALPILPAHVLFRKWSAD